MPTSGIPNQFDAGRVLRPDDAAYVAGLVDGEGTISFGVRKGRFRRSHHFTVEVSIANTSLGLLESVRETLGNGRIDINSRENGRKVCFTLNLSARQIRWLLPQIQPYLRLKRRQAELALGYFALQTVGLNSGFRGIADEHIPQALEMLREIRALNQRGCSDYVEPDVVIRPTLLPPTRICVAGGCGKRTYRMEDHCFDHWKERRTPVLRKCEECEGELDALMPHKRFCSSRCQWQHYYRTRMKPEAAAELQNRASRKCVGCEHYFLPVPETKEYCTKACYQKHRRKQKRAMKQPFQRQCLHCQQDFETFNVRKQCCSGSCATMLCQYRKWAEERHARV